MFDLRTQDKIKDPKDTILCICIKKLSDCFYCLLLYEYKAQNNV